VQELRAELSKTKEELQQRKNSESLLSKRLETTKEDLKRATSNVMMLNIQMEMGQNAITTGASMGGLGAVTKSNASDKPVMESSSPHTRDSREETVDFLEEIAQQSKSIPTSISRFSASGMPGPTSVSPEKAISPQR
jgi:predicted nuclease with TOPRIM domain